MMFEGKKEFSLSLIQVIDSAKLGLIMIKEQLSRFGLFVLI